MTRKNIPPTRCIECGDVTDDLDDFEQCIDCADELVHDEHPTCRVCGDEEGPYGGLCLDCLEADLEGVDSSIDVAS